MARVFRWSASLARSIHIPSSGTSVLSSWPERGNWARSDGRREQELADLDAQLRSLKAHQKTLRDKLKIDKDNRAQKDLATKENATLSGEATQAQLTALESQLTELDVSKPIIPAPKIRSSAVPSSIMKLLDTPAPSGANALALFSQTKATNWSRLLPKLPVLPDSIPLRDVEELVRIIPLKSKAIYADRLERIVPTEMKTQFVKDQLMAGHAEGGRVEDVQRIFDTCETPTAYSYGHLAKALFKVGSDPEQIIGVIKAMQKGGLKPTVPLMSCAVQSFIQHGKHEQAEKVFDNLKYWSIDSRPDTKLYNSMILSAAKQYKVNRCLDLLKEMKERRPYPLEPNEETYNYVVYACARSEETQQMAWDLFMEARDRGFKANLQSFRSLLYLCGNAGEVLLARALIRNLSETSPQYVDNFALNCLFSAYKNWRPGPSRILSTPSGKIIRANIMASFAKEGSLHLAEHSIPFLPTIDLTPSIVLHESSALFEYYAETNAQALLNRSKASKATSPILHNYLQVAIDSGDNISEFQRRYRKYTRFPVDERKHTQLLMPEDSEHDAVSATGIDGVPAASPSTLTFERDQHLYRLAIKAAIKFKDLEFARNVWSERGQWRRLPQFRRLSLEERNALDFQFARDLVELLAVCGQIEEAIILIKSARNLKRWTRQHLKVLLDTCEKIEDRQSTETIMKLVRSRSQ